MQLGLQGPLLNGLFPRSRLSATLALFRTAGAVSTLCRISCSANAFVPTFEVEDVLASEILFGDIEFRNFLGRMYLAVTITQSGRERKAAKRMF